MKLWLKFALAMSLSLAAVMAIAGYMIYSNGSQVAQRAQDDVMVESVKLTGRFAHQQADISRLKAERDALELAEQQFAKGGRMDPGVLAVRDAIRELREQRVLELTKAETELESAWKKGVDEVAYPGGSTFRYPVTFGSAETKGWLYRYRGQDDTYYELLVPRDVNMAEQGLLRVIVWATLLVILVGAGVASFVASTVSRPIAVLVHDIQQIAKGMLNHRAHGEGGGEVGELAFAINKMAKNLAEARETEVALSIREREVELAGEVRESLLPDRPPKLAGYDLASLHLASADLGGDFHDFITLSDGRVGLLVCDVSGKGVPGAMVGSMARAYLRSELARGGDVREALRVVNREIARDIRRGMFVTALYVLVDPRTHRATLACAGHKVPLLRVAKQDGKLRVVQPEGIALGFDKGPVFDRRLEVVDVPFEPGDRLVLCNGGTLAVANAAGSEIGEKPVYAAVQKHTPHPSEAFLERLKTVLEAHADGQPFAKDASLVTIART